MSFNVSKINGELCFKDFGGFETRNSSTIWCIQNADKIYNWDNFTELTIHTGDCEKKRK